MHFSDFFNFREGDCGKNNEGFGGRAPKIYKNFQKFIYFGQVKLKINHFHKFHEFFARIWTERY